MPPTWARPAASQFEVENSMGSAAVPRYRSDVRRHVQRPPLLAEVSPEFNVLVRSRPYKWLRQKVRANASALFSANLVMVVGRPASRIGAIFSLRPSAAMNLTRGRAPCSLQGTLLSFWLRSEQLLSLVCPLNERVRTLPDPSLHYFNQVIRAFSPSGLDLDGPLSN